MRRRFRKKSSSDHVRGNEFKDHDCSKRSWFFYPLNLFTESLSVAPYFWASLQESPHNANICLDKTADEYYYSNIRSTGEPMGKLVRFGVSLDQDLLGKFDRLMKGKNYTCRSEAFRDLIRQELVQKQWQSGQEVSGAITLIYDHHKRELVNKLMDIQHDFGNVIISSQHIHLDHSHCLEIIAVKGSAKEAQKLADNLKSVKGVKHGTLSMSTTGKDIG